MNEKYVEVPNNILTGKDLDYISDMFQWNYGALKKSNDYINKVNDQEIVTLLEKGSSLFDDNLNAVLNVLNEIGGSNNG